MFGKRVNLQEVEHIIRQKFNLADIAASGVDDNMKIFITEKNLSKEIAPYLSEKLNLHPAAFKIIVVDELPKTSAGKVIYSELQNM